MERGHEQKLIGKLLAKQPGIEDSFVMSNTATIPYYANSKFLYAAFQEGIKGDPLEKYLTRENWSFRNLDISNLLSNPSDRYHLQSPIPDYIVYEIPDHLDSEPDAYYRTQVDNLLILSDPKNPNIPSNFELIYKSTEPKFVVYKIHHGK